MDITAISDLHGHYPKLEGGDLLIVAGDLTRSDQPYQYEYLYDIFNEKKYKKIILIAGNHDNCIQNGKVEFVNDTKIEYLCDSGTEFEYYNPKFPLEDEGFLPSGKRNFKIWGSPWTLRFPGMNPHCMAFTVDTEEELAEKWKLIPEDVDILVTHSPLAGFLDRVHDYCNGKIFNVGSKSLKERIWRMENPPRLIICGHIHEGYGQTFDTWYEFSSDQFDMIIVNASHVNERYEPVNKPIRIEL